MLAYFHRMYRGTLDEEDLGGRRVRGYGSYDRSADSGGSVQAIGNNDLAALKAAISKGAVVNAGDNRGTTLLMEAAAYSSPEAVKLLLDSGANPNAKNQFGSTALTMAADQPEKARMLIERGPTLTR